MSPLEKLISGGQTGVDRAALDAGRDAGLALGGWCPAGRRAEDGRIPPEYPLLETPSADPAQRTAWNVRDADATLVLARGAPRGGTGLALERARRMGRPVLVVDLEAGAEPDQIRQWLETAAVRVLNVAGPRESEAPGIGRESHALLSQLLPTPRGEKEGGSP